MKLLSSIKDQNGPITKHGFNFESICRITNLWRDVQEEISATWAHITVKIDSDVGAKR